MPKQSILLTGATGFIGRHVARKLARVSDAQLICIARHGDRHPQAAPLIREGLCIIAGDFVDEGVLEDVFEQHRIQQVVHIAAIRGGGNASAAEFDRVNVKGTELLLRRAFECGVEKFIFCSSVGVYGTIPMITPAGLHTPLCGDSHYHQSKIAAENAVQSYIRGGLNAHIVRPAITYGSGDDGFPQTLVQLVKRHLLWLPSTSHRIHLAHVDRVAEVFCQLALNHHSAERVIVAADPEPVRFGELVDWIHQHFYGQPYPRYLRLPDWSFEMTSRLFRALRNEKWAARVALLSNDWSYQCAAMYEQLGIRRMATREAFELFLRENFPPGKHEWAHAQS